MQSFFTVLQKTENRSACRIKHADGGSEQEADHSDTDQRNKKRPQNPEAVQHKDNYDIAETDFDARNRKRQRNAVLDIAHNDRERSEKP